MRINDWLTHQSTQPDYPDQQDLRILLCHVLSVNPAWLMAHQDESLNTEQLIQLNQLAEQLSTGKPVHQLTGSKAFWDIELRVNEHTLIPRADTETIIETILDLQLNPSSILDLGTGSGALAIVLARLFPKARVLATDVQPETLQMAAQNQKLHNISNLQLRQSDWFSAIPAERFDLIVSNPPYIEPGDPHLEQLTFEPLRALVADNQGLAAYEAICADAGRYLLPHGVLMFEHGWQQHQQVAAIMQAAGLTGIRHQADLQGHIRVTWGRWSTG
jgi:release factor glutamine methyltransferase